MLRSVASARAVAREWRRLTASCEEGAGRRTLVACSGGADSTALLLVLAAASPEIVVGHVVHDLRGERESLADRDAVRGLAGGLGLMFVTASVAARAHPGNLEGNARRLRYAALAQLARESGCGFVATGHHAEDQLETMLMRLLRGAGPEGLRGLRRARRAEGVRVIRPMLEVTHADAEAICRAVGVVWREDATNADVSRRRGALRALVLPRLRELEPGGAVRASRAARLVGEAWALVEARALALRREDGWTREELRAEAGIVVGEVLRRRAAELTGGAGRDRWSGRVVDPAVRAVRDASTQPREYLWSGVRIVVTARMVKVERTGAAHGEAERA